MGQEVVLRQQLTASLEDARVITSPEVGRAFRAVPRHLFVPDSDIADAYQNEVIFTRSRDGISLSASSAPSIMAEMLELLALKPGHRVLEVGAGTGYNAAVMEEIVGPRGHVVTIDIDEDIVNEAVAHLRAAHRGERITVRCADGGLGWPEAAPYDRIIVAVGAWDVPPAWFQQLADGGRLVVPLDFKDVHKLVTFERRGDRMVSVDVRDCRFVRPQGILAGPEQQVPLAAGLYVSTSDAGMKPAEVAAIVAAGRDGPVEPLPAAMTPEELHKAFRLWLALKAPDFCLVSLEEEALRAGSVRAWQVTAERAVLPADENARFASAPGLADDQAICLLEPGLGLDGQPVLHGYGDAGQLVSRLRGYVQEWHDTGRPFAAGLAIVAVPVDEPVAKPQAGALLARKRWFRYLMQAVNQPVEGSQNA